MSTLHCKEITTGLHNCIVLGDGQRRNPTCVVVVRHFSILHVRWGVDPRFHLLSRLRHRQR